jgi:type III secretory pathway component EscS
MHKPAQALTIILMLLFWGVQAAALANANPVWATFLPETPDKNPPVINVLSPTSNQAYTTNNVTLNISVTEPDTWFRTNQLGRTKIGEISNIKYNLDETENQTVYMGSLELNPLTDHSWLPATKNVSISLSGLGDGVHTVTIYAEGITAYLPDQNQPFQVSNITVSSPPVAVTFTVGSIVSPVQANQVFNPWLTVALLCVLITVTAAGSLLYFKKTRN